MKVNGIYYVLVLIVDVQKNLDFYWNILGLKFVKKFVNQDELIMYYLFYGDEIVNLGFELMFFEILWIVLFYVGINSIFLIGLCVLDM